MSRDTVHRPACSFNARLAGFLAPAGLLFPTRSLAHGEGPLAPHDLWHSWNLEPWLLATFAGALLLYGTGVHRLWRNAGAGRGVSGLRVLSHAIGMTLLLVALVSPLDALGETLASAHMAQHMLLILAAPFLVLSAPLPVYLWALARRRRRALAHGTITRNFAGPWRRLSRPLVAWLLYALALWAWHAPALYEAALDVTLVHDLEHLSFVFTSLLLWWVVIRVASRPTGLMMLFTTTLHSGLLAALMSLASRPWYPVYADRTNAWGLTPLEDQHLAGLIMWIPGGVGYLVATLAMLVLWLRGLESRPASLPDTGVDPAVERTSTIS